jgi:hypothetical protein
MLKRPKLTVTALPTVQALMEETTSFDVNKNAQPLPVSEHNALHEDQTVRDSDSDETVHGIEESEAGCDSKACPVAPKSEHTTASESDYATAPGSEYTTAFESENNTVPEPKEFVSAIGSDRYESAHEQLRDDSGDDETSFEVSLVS